MGTLVLPGTLDSLHAIRRFAGQAAKNAGLDDAAIYKLSLAADEIATNIVIHGYQHNGLAGEIRVQSERSEQELIITLEDTAPPYDPRTHEMPSEDDLAKPLEDRTPGGLGVYLAIHNVDRFDYESTKNRNRSTLAMKLKERTGGG